MQTLFDMFESSLVTGFMTTITARRPEDFKLSLCLRSVHRQEIALCCISFQKFYPGEENEILIYVLRSLMRSTHSGFFLF